MLSYGFAYAYNLGGMLLEETYPSGRKVRNTIATDASLSKVESQPYGGSYSTRADNFTYTAAGAVSSMQLGNSKWENAQFNSRLQPTQLGLGTSATDQSIWKVNCDYGTTSNNGNVLSQTITVPSINPLIQTYTYDSLNRLKSAEETQSSSQTWKQTFTYDRYGNRNFDAANTTTLGSCPAAQCNPAVDAQNNRFTTNQGYTYDLSGNLVTDAQNRSFVYDAENKQKEVKDASNNTIGQYLYDGDGKRVKKISASDTTVFAYDASGKLAAEYLLTTATPNAPATSYLTNDTLGSPRVITDGSGNVQSRRDFMPFGEEISGLGNRTSAIGYQVDSTRQKFTKYLRDIETNLDFAQTRFFNSNVGRFISPDDFLNDSSVQAPQSWNKYVYVRNNPLKYIDAEGKKATVKIESDEKNKVVTIKIDASIVFYGGKRVSNDARDKAAATAAKNIADAWTGTYTKDGITYKVETTVTYTTRDTKDEAKETGFQNVVELVDGPVSYKDDSQSWRGGYVGETPDYGKWNINSVNTLMPQHEFGHFLGVDDRKTGNDLMFGYGLGNPSNSTHATKNDFEWALGREVDSHRNESRPFIPSGNPGYTLGDPQNRTSVTTIRAGRFWWK